MSATPESMSSPVSFVLICTVFPARKPHHAQRFFLLLFGAFRKQRYVYGTILDSIAKVTGIIKFDLHAEAETGKRMLEVGGNIKGIYDLGEGRYGSEAIYVPRETAEEDDGYLIFFVHDENTG